MLSECVHLERLDLSHNKLADIKLLESLQKLQWLNLSNNRLNSIDYLTTLPCLSSLFITSNKITVNDILSCLKLGKLKQLSTIFIIERSADLNNNMKTEAFTQAERIWSVRADVNVNGYRPDEKKFIQGIIDMDAKIPNTQPQDTQFKLNKLSTEAPWTGLDNDMSINQIPNNAESVAEVVSMIDSFKSDMQEWEKLAQEWKSV